MFWLIGPALVDVLATVKGSAVPWCPSRGEAGSRAGLHPRRREVRR